MSIESALQQDESGRPTAPYVATEDGKRRFASDIPHDEPGRPLHYGTSGKLGIESKWWKSRTGTYRQVYANYFVPQAQAQKDERAFFAGKLSGERCTAANVEQIEFVIADVDATNEDEVLSVLEAIQRADLGCDIYSTFNHGAEWTEVRQDEWDDFCREQGLDGGSSEAAVKYLGEVAGYRPDVARGASVKDRWVQSQEGLGTVTLLGHGPLIKLRFVFGLDEPYVPVAACRRGFTNADARGRLWNAAQTTLFEALGIPFDKATTKDVSRRFYAAACREGTEVVICKTITGKAVRLAAILPTTQKELDAIIPAKPATKARTTKADAGVSTAPRSRSPGHIIIDGRDLTPWAARHAKTFDIEQCFERNGLVRGARGGGGFGVHCFHGRHGEESITQTWVRNGEDGKGFVIACSGASGDCPEIDDKLVRLAKYIEAGKISIADLEDETLGGGPVPWCATTPDAVWALIEKLPDRPQVEHYAALLPPIGALPDGVESKMVQRIIDTLPEADEESLRAVIKIAAQLDDHAERDSAKTRIQKKIAPTQKNLPPILKASVLTALFQQEHSRFKAERKARHKNEQREGRSAARDEVERQACKLAKRFKWVLSANGFYDVRTGELRKVEAVYREVLIDLPRDQDGDPRCSPEQVLLLNRESKFDRLGYRPDQPAEFVDGRGLRCLNTYKPPSLAPVEGEVTPMLDHIKYIFGRDLDANPDPEAQAYYDVDECNHFLNWLAFKVQHPEVKVRHSALIGSKQGAGKGTIAEALKRIVGSHNFVAPSHEELLDKKHEYLEHRLWVVVHEVYDQKKTEVANILKPIMSEDTIRVKRNYLDRYEIENLASWLMFTNRYNAISVENGDRRYFLYDSKAKPRDKAYYTALHDWLDRGGAAIFMHWLLARDVSGFNPNAPAPMTAAKRDAIEASEGDAKVVLRELFEDREEPFHKDLVKLDDVKRHLSFRELRVSRPMLVAFLKDRGAEPLEDGSTRYTEDKGSGGKARMWALRDAQKWRSATPLAKGQEFLKGAERS